MGRVDAGYLVKHVAKDAAEVRFRARARLDYVVVGYRGACTPVIAE